MSLPRSLRALLGSLAIELDGDEVRELLILGAGVARVVRGRDETRIPTELTVHAVQRLAARIERELSGRSTGRIGDFDLRVVRATPSARGPTIRFVRRFAGVESLGRLVERGFINDEFVRFIESPRTPLALLVVGPSRSGKSTLVASIAAARADAVAPGASCAERVAILDETGGALAASDAFDLVLPKERGVELALELGADLIVTDGLDASGWRALFASGRPFVATFEARSHEAALEALRARLLASDPGLSREAAQALLEAAVDRVLELDRDPGTREAHVVGFRTPSFPVSATVSTEDMVPRRQPAASPPQGAREPEPPPEIEDRDKTPIPAPAPKRIAPGRKLSSEVTPADVERLPEPPRPVPEDRAVTQTPRLFARELSGTAGMPSMSASPVPTMNFENPELSGEIRPEQLMSDSFVMSLDDLQGSESLQRIVAIDVVEGSTSSSPSTPAQSPGPAVVDAPLVRPDSDARAEPLSSADFLRPTGDIIHPPESPAHAPWRARTEPARSESDLRARTRRETPERTPTELLDPNSPEALAGGGVSPPIDDSLVQSEFDSTQSARLGEMAFNPALDDEVELPEVSASKVARVDSESSAPERATTHLAREATLDLGQTPSDPSERRGSSRPSPLRSSGSAGRFESGRSSSSSADRRGSGRGESARGDASAESAVARSESAPSGGGSKDREPKPRLPSLTGEEIEALLGDLPDVGPEADRPSAPDGEDRDPGEDDESGGSDDAGPADDEPGAGVRRGARSSPDLRPRRRLR